jgi:hypothetical protein
MATFSLFKMLKMSAKYPNWQAMRNQEWHQEVKDLTVTIQQVNFILHVQSKEASGYFSRGKMFHVFTLPFYTNALKMHTFRGSLVMKRKFLLPCSEVF